MSLIPVAGERNERASGGGSVSLPLPRSHAIAVSDTYAMHIALFIDVDNAIGDVQGGCLAAARLQPNCKRDEVYHLTSYLLSLGDGHAVFPLHLPNAQVPPRMVCMCVVRIIGCAVGPPLALSFVSCVTLTTSFYIRLLIVK